MIEVEVNGVIHEFPEGTSQDVIRGALQRKYAPQPQLTPAQEFANESPIGRTIGRTVRTGLTGLSSLADIGLLVPKTAALGAGMVAENMGAEGLGRTLQSFGATPTMAETTRSLIDQATGGKLQDINGIEKAASFGGELISGSVPFTKAPQAMGMLNQPTIKTAVTSMLDPETALNQLPAVQKTSMLPRPTAENVRKQAGQLYKTATQKGGVIKPEIVDNFIDELQRTVKPQDEVAAALTKDDPANEALSIFEELMRGKEMTLDRLQAVDEALTQKIDKYVELGRPKKEGLGLLKIQDKLRKTIGDVDESMIEGGKEGFEALKQGRKLWSKAAKMRDIEAIMTRAEMSDQPANAMRAGFKTLYNNPNRIRGYSAEEKDLIRRAAKDNLPMEVLRGVASRLFGIGSGVAGGPAGFAVGKGLEMGARGLRENMANARAQGVIDLISGYSPPSNPLLTPQGSAALIGATGSQGTQMIAPPMKQIPYNSMLRVQ